MPCPESVAVLLEVHALDAFALELVCLVRMNSTRSSSRPGVVVEEGRHIGIAPEGRKVSRSMKLAGVAVRPIMRASKYSMTSVNRLKSERSFIEDDEVEETWIELGVAERQRLLGGDEEAFGLSI